MSVRVEGWCDMCDYRGVYSSVARADLAYRRHACTARQDRVRRRADREARLAEGGVRRDCRCPRAGHRHGTYPAYKRDGCRCRPCCKAVARYEKRRQLLAGSGRGNLVDAGPARRRLQRLLQAGLSLSQIEQRSGVNRTALRVLLGDVPGRAASDRVTRATAAKILAVPADRVGPERHGLLDPTGTARRVQALVCRGWTLSAIAREIGYLPCNFVPVAHGRRPVRAATRAAVVDLYDRWWDLEPPQKTPAQRRASSRARRMAAVRGWLPPMAWDDDLIDDPNYEPTTAEDGGPGRRRVHVDEVEFLAQTGHDAADVCRRLGVAAGTLQTTLERAGRRDLWLQVSRLAARRRTAPRRVA